MQQIDPKDFQERLGKITQLYSEFVVHAKTQSRSRCPYRNRLDECTAKFECRNQLPAPTEGGPPLCSGKYNYCSAWGEDAPNCADR